MILKFCCGCSKSLKSHCALANGKQLCCCPTNDILSRLRHHCEELNKMNQIASLEDSFAMTFIWSLRSRIAHRRQLNII